MPASLAASARGKPSSAPAIACRRAAAARSFSRRASRRSSSAGRSVRIVSARPPICVLPQPGWTQPESLRPASTQITSESENSRVGIRPREVLLVLGGTTQAASLVQRLGCRPGVQALAHLLAPSPGQNEVVAAVVVPLPEARTIPHRRRAGLGVDGLEVGLAVPLEEAAD